jgi:hypothetical protein
MEKPTVFSHGKMGAIGWIIVPRGHLGRVSYFYIILYKSYDMVIYKLYRLYGS